MDPEDMGENAGRTGVGVARNSALNLIGQGIPLLAAFFAIPLLLRGLGTDRFGVLTLAWIVIGYFSLFDLGLGRALTQVVSATLGERPSTVAPPIVLPLPPLMMPPAGGRRLPWKSLMARIRTSTAGAA